jgi:hypothetical protein
MTRIAFRDCPGGAVSHHRYVVAAISIFTEIHSGRGATKAYNLDKAPVIFRRPWRCWKGERQDLCFDILMPGGMEVGKLAQRARDMVPGLWGSLRLGPSGNGG